MHLCLRDLGNVWAALAPADGPWDELKQRLVSALGQFLPDVVDPYVQATAAATATWYDELAPRDPYKATVPDDIVTTDRIKQSISWAINTALTAESALTQLRGSVQRMVADGHRETLVHNAVREGVRFQRVTHGGACDWCLLMASRGAVYHSAASAIRGHDHDACIAVPIRRGTRYEPPPEVADAARRYEDATRSLLAQGKAVDLSGVLAMMRSEGGSPRNT